MSSRQRKTIAEWHVNEPKDVLKLLAHLQTASQEKQ